MDKETIGDSCLVAGTLVAADFRERGFVVRKGFEHHAKVQRFLAKYGHPPTTTVPHADFENLTRDAICY